MSLVKTHLALAIAAIASQSAFAGTVVVTPTNMQGWQVTDYRGASNGYTSNTVAAIDATYKPAGQTGSAHLATTDGSGKADFTLSLLATPVTLGSLTSLSYDWYRSSASTTTQWLTPALRVIYDADGNLATTADEGYMIFEPVYNEVGNNAAPTNSWVHEDVLNAIYWQRQLSPGATTMNGPNQVFQTLAAWQVPGQQGDGDLLSPASLILGLNFGVGSGWNATFDGAVDNVSFGVNGVATTYNFESTAAAAVPEPSGVALLALGLAALGLSARRKRG